MLPKLAWLPWLMLATFAVASTPVLAGVALCTEGHDDTDTEDDVAVKVQPERLILPCALAESGSACADAAIYVVSTQGVLLCQIDIPALQAQSALPEVDSRPAAPAPGSSSAFFAAGLPVGGFAVPPVLVRDVGLVAPREALRPSDGHTRLLTPPS